MASGTPVLASSFDAIVIGAGHNGLVAANYLARAGRRTLVLEARGIVGGACVTEELIPGSRWSSCAFIAGLLRPEIIETLELSRFGLELYQGDALSFALFPDGSHLFLWKEIDRTLRELERFSAKDAQAFLDFGLRLQKFAGLVTPWLMKSPPSRSQLLASFERVGEQRLFDEFTVLSVRDLLDRYFDDEHIKSFLTFFGMVSIWGGPSTPGTSYVWGHHSWGEFEGQFGQYGYVRGGMGAITQALARSAEQHGAEIRLNARVDRIVVERGRCVGVELASGERVDAAQVLSNADPKRSLLSLVDSRHLDPGLRDQVDKIDMRGSMARIHLLIDQLPQYLPFPDASEGPQHHGHQLLGASRETFELAWEAQRRGTFPDSYVIEAVIQSVTDPGLAPPGMHTMTLGIQQLPFELLGTTWDAEKEKWADAVLEDLFRYAPNLRGHIADRAVITPQDLDREYLITGGNIFHGGMLLDQLFASRPLDELASYRTPITGYYLCGAGTHPGGGVMGASGHNAAMIALFDAGIGPDPALEGLGGPVQIGNWPGRAIARVMASEAGRKIGYRLARQPLLRRLTNFAARARR